MCSPGLSSSACCGSRGPSQTAMEVWSPGLSWRCLPSGHEAPQRCPRQGCTTGSQRGTNASPATWRPELRA
eukprot:11658774-Prorocentrum_lima.AAC.1